MSNRALLVVGGVGLKQGRINNAQKAMISLAKDLNPYLREADFLKDAPFGLINFIFRYGDTYSEIADIGKVDGIHNELPVSVEVPLEELRAASFETVRAAFASVLVPALMSVAQKFQLSTTPITRFVSDFKLELEA